MRAAEQERPDVAVRRRIWRAAQPFVDADKLVFIDETGATTKMARRLVTLPCDHRYDERALSRLVEAVQRLGSATRARAAHPIVTALRGGE